MNRSNDTFTNTRPILSAMQIAQLHEGAKRRATELRREAMNEFWIGIGAATKRLLARFHHSNNASKNAENCA
jgi:hypothetical protein